MAPLAAVTNTRFATIGIWLGPIIMDLSYFDDLFEGKLHRNAGNALLMGLLTELQDVATIFVNCSIRTVTAGGIDNCLLGCWQSRDGWQFVTNHYIKCYGLAIAYYIRTMRVSGSLRR